MTHRLDVTYIAISLHEDIPYGYLVMASKSKRSNSETEKGEQSFFFFFFFFVRDTQSYPYTHCYKSDQDIQYGYLVLA